MRKIKEVLRLNWSQGLSARQIARSCGIARSTVQEFLNRAQVAGLSWPLPPEVDDFILENLLFPPKAPGPIHHPAPDIKKWDRFILFSSVAGLALETQFAD